MTRRRRYTLGAAIWLLIGLATVALWARSYFKGYGVSGPVGDQVFFIDLSRGIFEFGWDTNYSRLPGFHFGATGPDDIDDLDHGFAGFGFTCKTEKTNPSDSASRTFRVINIPGWSIVLVAGAGFLYCARHRRGRFPEGCCRRCGYNLTGNLSGTCPECGKSV